ncbi:hypothetical protein ACTFIZ_003191 [Dictyostelium cf. discoideum]
MKFLAIFLILVSILGLSNAIQNTQHINAKVYCNKGCSSTTYNDVSININQCTLLPKESTCDYALPYILVSPLSNSSYTVSAQIACDRYNLASYKAIVGQCNSYFIDEIEFSIYAYPPVDGAASSSSNLKPIALFSAFVIFIVSLVL